MAYGKRSRGVGSSYSGPRTPRQPGVGGPPKFGRQNTMAQMPKIGGQNQPGGFPTNYGQAATNFGAPPKPVGFPTGGGAPPPNANTFGGGQNQFGGGMQLGAPGPIQFGAPQQQNMGGQFGGGGWGAPPQNMGGPWSPDLNAGPGMRAPQQPMGWQMGAPPSAWATKQNYGSDPGNPYEDPNAPPPPPPPTAGPGGPPPPPNPGEGFQPSQTGMGGPQAYNDPNNPYDPPVPPHDPGPQVVDPNAPPPLPPGAPGNQGAGTYNPNNPQAIQSPPGSLGAAMGGTQGGWAGPHGGPRTPPPDPNRRKPKPGEHKAKLQELFKKHGNNREAYYKELREWQASFNEPERRIYPTGDDGIYPGHPDWPKDMPGPGGQGGQRRTGPWGSKDRWAGRRRPTSRRRRRSGQGIPNFQQRLSASRR